MKILIYGLAIISLFFISYSCTLDSEQEYFAETICDTTDVTYQTVRSTFIENCAICHSASYTYRDGIELDVYESTVSSINSGLVIPAIKHTGPYQMPNGQPQLPDCLIRQIELWVENGMPETEADL